MSSAPPRTEIPRPSELPLVLETPRIRLRPLAASDADTLYPIVSDPALSPLMTWRAHASIDETRAWIAATAEGIANGTDVTWAIEHEGSPAGCIGLHGITWAVRAVRWDKAEMGYWLAPAHWRKGLVTEAATLVMRWTFETLGLHKITIGCFDENLASRRVIEKVGFRFVGRAEDDVWRDGRWFAHLRYELLASEWADSTRTLRFARPS